MIDAIDTSKMRKVADWLDLFNKNSMSVNTGELNVLIREVTEALLTWQNIPEEAAKALVEAAYQAGR
jgi:hypothetical protein